MDPYRLFLRPILFRFDAERMHDRAIDSAERVGRSPFLRRLLSRRFKFSDPRLESEVCGLRFPYPVGLAAGYDKNGRTIEAMSDLGFGFVEIGSVSADASDGNPKPRLFRVPADRAIVVNYGLPNEGAEAVASRLAAKRIPVPLGVNIVKTNRLRAEPEEEILADYHRSVSILRGSGDYLVLNLSCPNTETLFRGCFTSFPGKGSRATTGNDSSDIALGADLNRWKLCVCSTLWVQALVPCFHYWLPLKLAVDWLGRTFSLWVNTAFVVGNVVAFLIVLFVFSREDLEQTP